MLRELATFVEAIAALFPHRGRHGRVAYSVNAPAIVKGVYGSQAMTTTWINLVGLILLMMLQPIGGMISDRQPQATATVVRRRRTHLYTRPCYLSSLKHVRRQCRFYWWPSAVILTGYCSINTPLSANCSPRTCAPLVCRSRHICTGELGLRRHRADLQNIGTRSGADVHRL